MNVVALRTKRLQCNMAGFQGFFAFAETARQGSFAGAARELGLSPSAVAKSVSRPDQDPGLALFPRPPRQVHLVRRVHWWER